jgi:hypothetical protein
VKFPEEFRSSAAATDEFQWTGVLAPCRDGEVPPEPSPSVSIAVSINLTAMSIAVAASYMRRE